jgi:hypothetical protein
MAIAFAGDGPHPQEREAAFRLVWQGRTYPFKSALDFGDAKVKRAYPGLDPVALFGKLNELNEKNWVVTSLPLSVPAAMGAMPEFGEIFVALLHALVTRMDNGTSRKSVYLRPFGSNREWSVEGPASGGE